MTLLDVPILAGRKPATAPWTIRIADEQDIAAYHRLRQASFVQEQGLFAGTDRDDLDDDPRTIVLVARAVT